MSKIASPLLGYNNNVRHKNRVFHIQTEDSGVKHPHIITHLFMDGGRILKSIKRSYAEHVGADKMQDTVKQMMKEQHKAMFIALRDGQFDGMLDDGAKAAQAASADKEAREAKEAKEKESKAREKEAKAEAAAALAAPPVPAVSANSKNVAAAVAAQVAAAAQEAGDDVEMVPQTTRMPEMTLDIGAIERAASPATALRQLSDLPPPPPNMFRDKSAASGAYRTSTPAAETAGKRGSGPPPKPPSSPPKKPASQPAGARGKAARQRGATRPRVRPQFSARRGRSKGARSSGRTSSATSRSTKSS